MFSENPSQNVITSSFLFTAKSSPKETNNAKQKFEMLNQTLSPENDWKDVPTERNLQEYCVIGSPLSRFKDHKYFHYANKYSLQPQNIKVSKND